MPFDKGDLLSISDKKSTADLWWGRNAAGPFLAPIGCDGRQLSGLGGGLISYFFAHKNVMSQKGLANFFSCFLGLLKKTRFF